MTKRLLSMILSVALLLSCVSGITLFTAAEELPTPYVWLTVNQADGTTSSGGLTGIAAQEPDLGGTTTPVAIADTGTYGIKLGAQWGGFGINAKDKVANAGDIALAVEYYINQDNPAGDSFRVAVEGQSATVVSVASHNLVGKQTGVVVIPFTADQKAALNNGNRLYILGWGGCGTDTYVKSLKVIEAEYTNVITDPGYEYYDFSGNVTPCAYYPEITTPNAYLMGYTDEENPFRQYKVNGVSYSATNEANKPVYIKFYTNEGYENTTVTIDTYQVYGQKSDGSWAATHSALTGHGNAKATVVNGVGGVLLAETCFRNSANSGSFRVNVNELPKIKRVEVYDLATYCGTDLANTDTVAEIHALQVKGLINVVKEGYQAPTVDEVGATGTLTCATCDELLAESTEIPKVSKYAKLDFVTGEAVGTAMISKGGNYVIEKIPGTDYYAAKLTEHNSGMISFAIDPDQLGIAPGTSLAIAYEYYLTDDWGNNNRLTLSGSQLYLGAYGSAAGSVFDCLPINHGGTMTRGALDVLTYTVGSDVEYTIYNDGKVFPGGELQLKGSTFNTASVAEDLLSGRGTNLICWNSGAGAAYIKSITICAADELGAVGGGSEGYYIDFVGAAVNPYYPEYTEKSSYGLSYATESVEWYPEDTAQEYDRFTYMYVKAPAELLSTEKGTPVKLVIERKEGSEVAGMKYQYQDDVAGADMWSAYYTVEFDENGKYEVILMDALFNNSLNGGSSIRMCEVKYEQVKDEETGEISYVEKIGDEFEFASIQVYDLREDCTQYHDQFTEANRNLIGEGRIEPTYEQPGYTGELKCAHCGEVLKEGEEIPMLANFVKFDFSDGTAKLQGVKKFTELSGETSLVPVEIPGNEGVYGLMIDTHNSGVKFALNSFGGFNADSIANGQELAISVEYYIPSDMGNDLRITFDGGNGGDKIFAIYGSYANTSWDCVVVNPAAPLAKGQLNVATFKVGKNVAYTTGAGQFGAANKFDEPVTVGTEELALDLVNGDEVALRIWKNNAAPLYIKSITIYDGDDVAERDVAEGKMDYIDYISEFRESPVYYPQYSIKGYSDGLTCSVVEEGQDAEGNRVAYGYFAVTRAKLPADKESHPVMIRFTFKEDCELTNMNWSYQVARRSDENPGIEWGHLNTEITDTVVEVLLEDAVFTNELNGKGSFRLPNGDTSPAVDNLVKVEVLAVVDKTALEEIVDSAKEDTQYKTPASVEAYMEAIEAAKDVLADGWATEADVAATVAALEAAKAQLVDCDHSCGTEAIGFKEATCFEPGYTGDAACIDCGFVDEADKGQEIPAHDTKIINVKDATCAEEGNKGDTWCEVCQKIVKKGESIPALPHTWDEGVVTKEATKDERGEITKTCDVCGETSIIRFDFVAQLGDVDGNGKIDSTDARLVLQFAVKKIAPTDLDLEVADVDGNGKVDSTDARLILQYAVKKIDKLPAAK